MASVSRRYAAAPTAAGRTPATPDAQTRAPVVLMVSGGADSTALLVLAATSSLNIDDGRGRARIARERLHVLHINHQLRGIDATEDEEFVASLADRFGIPCTIRRVDVAALAAQQGADSNTENVGREVRYAAAAELANQLSEKLGTPRSCARIVTAHTANDRAETFFMNAIRGTGPAGLSSIPRRRNRIVRPLLEYTHRELCDLLRMRGIVWREDATNEDTRYLRAYVRHEVMPVVEHRNPRVIASLSTTCDILADEDSYLHAQAARMLRDLTRRQAEGMLALDAARLAAADVVPARRVVRQAVQAVCAAARLEARHVDAVLGLVAAGKGSCALPLAVDVRVEYGLLFLRAHDAGAGIIGAWLEVPGTLELAGGRTLTARIRRLDGDADPIAMARSHAQEWMGASLLLDAAACGVDPTSGGRLWVDAPHQGDVLCPLGMHGQSKLVSDLLNEAKIPAADRDGVPVVRQDPTGQIVWVAPIRADERAALTPSSRHVVELTIEQR